MEVALEDSVLNPVETHVHGFGHFLSDAFVGDANGGGIINLDRGGGLGMPHFNERGAYGNSGLAIEKEGAIFRFSSGGHDIAQNFAEHMYKTIEEGRVVRKGERGRIGVAEEVDSTGSTAGFGNR